MYQHILVSRALQERKTAPTLQVKLGRHPNERKEQEERTERRGTDIREKRVERETDVGQVEEERTERRGRRETGVRERREGREIDLWQEKRTERREGRKRGKVTWEDGEERGTDVREWRGERELAVVTRGKDRGEERDGH
jgi:hypothetical protein